MIEIYATCTNCGMHYSEENIQSCRCCEENICPQCEPLTKCSVCGFLVCMECIKDGVCEECKDDVEID